MEGAPLIDGFLRVETERFWLERWDHERHGPGLDAVNADPEVMTYLNAGVPFTRYESRELSFGIARHWETYGFGLWAVVEKMSGETLGFAGICRPLWFPALLPAVEVGWRLRREAWGSGYATEGARPAIRAGFEQLGLDQVIALVHPENARSAAVTRRLGMRLDRRVDHPFRSHPLDVFVARVAEAEAPAPTVRSAAPVPSVSSAARQADGPSRNP